MQHREGIYWCLALLRDEDQHSYKVRNVRGRAGGTTSSHRRVRLQLSGGE
jgi:hypothetical protein